MSKIKTRIYASWLWEKSHDQLHHSSVISDTFSHDGMDDGGVGRCLDGDMVKVMMMSLSDFYVFKENFPVPDTTAGSMPELWSHP